jgi:hypothetical protein
MITVTYRWLRKLPIDTFLFVEYFGRNIDSDEVECMTFLDRDSGQLVSYTCDDEDVKPGEQLENRETKRRVQNNPRYIFIPGLTSTEFYDNRSECDESDEADPWFVDDWVEHVKSLATPFLEENGITPIWVD